MMLGVVNDNCEAIIKVAVGYANLPKIMVEAVIDTVDVVASEAEPLVGMVLLYGFKVQIEAVEGGTVRIESLSR